MPPHKVLPYLRKLACSPSHGWLSAVMPTSWSSVWDGGITVHGQQQQGRPGGTVEGNQLTGLVEDLSLEDAIEDE